MPSTRSSYSLSISASVEFAVDERPTLLTIGGDGGGLRVASVNAGWHVGSGRPGLRLVARGHVLTKTMKVHASRPAVTVTPREAYVGLGELFDEHLEVLLDLLIGRGLDPSATGIDDLRTALAALAEPADGNLDHGYARHLVAVWAGRAHDLFVGNPFDTIVDEILDAEGNDVADHIKPITVRMYDAARIVDHARQRGPRSIAS